MPPDGPPRRVRFCCLEQHAPEGLPLRTIAAECDLQTRTFWVSRGGLSPLSDWASTRPQQLRANQPLH
eukprot:8010919-Prorocentrum_lima.AAC.1